MTDRFEASRPARHIHTIEWPRLTLGQQLGEGASGVIYQATLLQAAGPVDDVAVKLFKSAVTSDGLPRCELAACMVVGAHPQVVNAIGRIAGHPDGTQGLVMPLIASHYRNLAAPPSLASCTRDVYAPRTVLALHGVLRLARGMAGAVRHLHASGLMHGDLYAHNILSDAEGACLLGDFGAASFLPTHDTAQAQALQRMEVRAFGILLGELLALCQPVTTHTPARTATRAALGALRQQCTQKAAFQRPMFDGIERQLTALISSI
jgi:serine/threonine protein kinase